MEAPLPYVKIGPMYRLLLLACLALLAACAGKLEGTACLDGNGNNACEQGEHTLTNIGLKISKDGQLLTQIRTNSLGRYSHTMAENGYYCVEVDEPYLEQSLMFQLAYGQLPPDSVQPVESNVSLGPPLGMSLGQVLSSPPGGTTTTQPTTQPAEDEEEEEEDEPPPQPSPSHPDSVEPGKACKNITTLGQTLHVPVLPDYSADVERMPPRIKQERRVGEIFTVPIPVSIGCILEALYLCDGLIPLWPTTVEEINKILNIDRETGRIDFRQQAQAASVVLHLKVKEDLPLGTYECQIEPVILCPGNQRVELQAVPIDLIARPFIDILQELPNVQQTVGDLFNWTIMVNNEGSQTLALNIVGTASGPIAALSPSSGLCRALGSNRVECNLDIEGGQLINLVIGVRLLDAIAGDEAHAIFDATAEVEDYADENFTAAQGDVRVVPE